MSDATGKLASRFHLLRSMKGRFCVLSHRLIMNDTSVKDLAVYHKFADCQMHWECCCIGPQPFNFSPNADDFLRRYFDNYACSHHAAKTMVQALEN